ncbi:hypothetical protein K3495_g4176 [Podosphaera aphanis]|nr:hypothetical protein K3495_g4176 [Podosphaera aphanis]
MRKLREYYWPSLAKDTHDYTLGHLYCAKHGTARRSQSQSSPSVAGKMVLLGMDFKGPLPQARLSVEESIQCCFPQFSDCTVATTHPPENGFAGSQFTHIFLVIDYFSRFVWAFPVSAANQTEAIRCLIWLFQIWGPPRAIYSDIGTHFSGATMQKFLSSQGTLWIPAPSGSKRSTGMVEKANDLLERILKKISQREDWPFRVQRSAYELNRREVRSLGFSPYEIMFGYQPSSSSELKIPTLRHEDEHASAVLAHMANLEVERDKVIQKYSLRRQLQKNRHDLGVSRNISYSSGDLVMLYDHSAAKRKLCASYRGPFIISGLAGDNGKSYTLRQVNGEPIRNTYHGDQLRPFRLREGYLVTDEELGIKVYQNIRLGRSRHKLSAVVELVPGAHCISNAVDLASCFPILKPLN